ncbi:helix-turn-helix domain-containing protein [Nocardioides sp.]|uniref:helix-turn-helix domain-containing protein n=1 Tax=Nocardioides sp. TaxID=35761 RepID=UPI0039E6A168
MTAAGWVGIGHLLKPDEAADRLGVSVWTLARLRRDGLLAAIRVANAWRYDPADLDTYISNHRSEAWKN